jgi:uncharacterized protein YecT (DUF1311 family)
MNKYLLLSAVTFLPLLAGGALSSYAAENCKDTSTQAAITECAVQSYERTDAELNRLYKEINKRLKKDKDAQKLLVNTQRSWIAYRDSECKFSTASVQGGSIYPAIYAQCLEKATVARIKEFETYLNCSDRTDICAVPSAD